MYVPEPLPTTPLLHLCTIFTPDETFSAYIPWACNPKKLPPKLLAHGNAREYRHCRFYAYSPRPAQVKKNHSMVQRGGST